MEQHCNNVELINFSRPMDKDALPAVPTLRARYLTHQTIEADGKVTRLTEKEQVCLVNGDLRSLKLTDN